MTTKHFEKRFGMVAVEKGFVTSEQIVEAIAIQVEENVDQQKHRFIGTVLVELGYMRHSQIQDVLTLMGISEQSD